MENIKVARLEVLLYNMVQTLKEQSSMGTMQSEEEFALWLEKETGMRKAEYDAIQKGESIC